MNWGINHLGPQKSHTVLQYYGQKHTKIRDEMQHTGYNLLCSYNAENFLSAQFW